MLHSLKNTWFFNTRGDVLAGLVVALALIPEAIAFSIIAGVDPKVGLYASFCIAVVIAFVGGRPGMISAATGAMALVMVTLVKEHGLQYLLAATLLTGVLQIGAGYLRLGSLMRFVSRSVVTGFVNALAILIFMAQLPELTNVTWQVYAMCAAGLAVVGLLESMMTATIVDDLTDTESDKNRECKGQGMANIASGLLGGMAGCAMIGQSVINVKSGGRGRLSCLVAGVVLLLMVVFLSDWVSQIPMAALVAVMIMVSIGTFSWDSIRNLKQFPLSTNIVMLATVAVTVYTHNLAYGVFVGVLLAALFFANKIGHFLYIQSQTDGEDRQRTYQVIGQVFFASADKFIAAFDFKEAIDKVIIDLSRAHFWDITAVAALDKVVIKLRREGTEVEVIGLNTASATIVDRFAVHDKDNPSDLLSGH
ncbi:SulP family inorganic anion transporter [Pseudomonas fluvialis]|uniref:SulP family inorganic anion transporter n=1 Tax=Pseudomonas fluvialis TaxID=1793966 RepID=UPI00370B68FE